MKTFHLALASLILTGCACQNEYDWCCLRQENNEKDKHALYVNVDIVPERPLTLDDIVSIASHRNLSLLVKEKEYEIQCEAATRQKFKMLPKLQLNTEQSFRNKNTGSSSESLTNRPPAPPSISSTQYTRRFDTNLVYNVVDFGLAYFRSKQECNKIIVAQMEYQRLKQNLMIDIVRQYWKCIVSRLALGRAQEIIEKTEMQMANLQRQMEANVISEIQGLRNQNQLVTIVQQLRAYETDYHRSLAELGLLMGLPPSINYDLADVESYETDVRLCEVEQLEAFALLNRPELFSADVEEQIKRDDVRAVITSMFPGLELFTGPYVDANPFLVHNNWATAGLRIAWDLLSLPGLVHEKHLASQRVELARKNRLAVAIGVMSQVHMAYYTYHDNLESFITAQELNSINKRMLQAAKIEQRQGKLHEADILKYEAEATFSEIGAFRAFAELQNSVEQLNNAIGMPFYFQNSYKYFAYEQEPKHSEFLDYQKEEEEEEFEETPIDEVAWIYKIA